MKTRTQVAICYTALIISVIFLIIAVDYLPLIVCWLPIMITAFITLHCKAFAEHLMSKLENVMPID